MHGGRTKWEVCVDTLYIISYEMECGSDLELGHDWILMMVCADYARVQVWFPRHEFEYGHFEVRLGKNSIVRFSMP